MAGELDTNAGAAPAEQATNDQASSLERREALRRFGVYAACAAPAMTVLMSSRQSEAGGFLRNSATAVATAAAGPLAVAWSVGGGGGGGGGGGAAVSPADIQLSCGREIGPGRRPGRPSFQPCHRSWAVPDIEVALAADRVLASG